MKIIKKNADHFDPSKLPRNMESGFMQTIPDPKSVKEALQGPFAEKCKEAMKEEYNSLIRLVVTTEKRTRSVAGSIFGGESRIVEVKGIKIDSELGNFNIYITNKDKVGVINQITNILFKNNINIATFNLGRLTQDGDAIAILQTDQLSNADVLNKIRRLKNVNQVKSIIF